MKGGKQKMTDKAMEAQIRELVKKFNNLPNKSDELILIKDVIKKTYILSIKSLGDKVGYNTPFLAELEGVVIGLLIANDYDYFGKGVKNPLYRFRPKKIEKEFELE